jgi:hypothetical protein
MVSFTIGWLDLHSLGSSAFKHFLDTFCYGWALRFPCWSQRSANLGIGPKTPQTKQER